MSQEAADAAKSTMRLKGTNSQCHMIGLPQGSTIVTQPIKKLMKQANNVQIAIYLCTGNYAVSGGLKGVEAVEAMAKSFRARMTARLAVAGAFHTSFMEPAVLRLEAALAATEIRSPRIPVISNVDAQPRTDPGMIKKILACQ